MKKLIIFLSGFFLVTACQHNFAPLSPIGPQRPLTSEEQALVVEGNQFSWKLFKVVAEREDRGNVVVSPLSAAFTLAMTLNGARGETLQAIEEVLGLQDLTIAEINESFRGLMNLLVNIDPVVTFELANSVWYRRDFVVEEQFLNLVHQYFAAKISGLDFSDPDAVNIINNWVSQKTRGKIEKLIDQIPADAVLYVINALYFKGIWKTEFDEKLTQDDQFHISESETLPIKMMKARGKFNHFKNDQLEGVDLPYGNGFYRMTILLPHQGLSVGELIGLLDSETWEQWRRQFQEEEGVVQLPKCTAEFKIDLTEPLTQMGMGVAFQGGRADFSGISSRQPLFISRVLHQTYVAIDEKGTEAAAASAVEVGKTSIGGQSFFMRVDRPFVFIIWDQATESILFLGKIGYPNS